jgi:hypothetical protein
LAQPLRGQKRDVKNGFSVTVNRLIFSMRTTQLFLSAVTREFGKCRDDLRQRLSGPGLITHIQEDFIASGTPTLSKLDFYISRCDGVVHLVGDMTGSPAQPESLEWLKQHHPRFTDRFPQLQAELKSPAPTISYTQWEAYLAIYHKINLFIAVPKGDVARDPSHETSARQKDAQLAHLGLLAEFEHYPEIHFEHAADIAARIWQSLPYLESGSRAVLGKEQVNLLLVLLDRENAVAEIVKEPHDGFQLVYGTSECVPDALIQRLRQVELPWLTRLDGGDHLAPLTLSEWRTHVARGGEPTAWALHGVDWPEPGNGRSVQQAHDIFLDTLRRLLSPKTLGRSETSTTWLTELEPLRARHLVNVSLDDYSEHADENAKLILLLSQTFQEARCPRLQVVVYLRTSGSRWRWLGWTNKHSILTHLEAIGGLPAVALTNVQRNQLIEWAGLSENVASVAANVVMEEIDDLYARASIRNARGLWGKANKIVALPMRTLRNELKSQVENWPTKA